MTRVAVAILGLLFFSSVSGFPNPLYTKVVPTANALFFDWEGESFSNYAQELELCSRVANMDPVAREVCVATGSDQITDPGGAMEIAQVLNDYFAADAADSGYQEVVRFWQFGRAVGTMGKYSVCFDSLRRKAGSDMQVGGAFPGPFASVLHVQNAPLPPA